MLEGCFVLVGDVTGCYVALKITKDSSAPSIRITFHVLRKRTDVSIIVKISVFHVWHKKC